MSPGQDDRRRPRLTVVISTLGNYATLERVLDGYAQQEATPDSFEVIVVMDAADPEPGLVEGAIGNRHFPVRRITGLVPGLSANRNAGWRAADTPLVMFTDNDTIPVPHLVTEHLDWHRRYPEETTGVLGRVRWAPELEVSVFMRWLDMGMQGFADIKEIDAGWGRFVGANASVKRSFIEQVGDFDQEHFPYGYEDTDWACRASKLGFRLMYNRDALVDHLRPMTLEFWKKRARRVAAAEYVFTGLHPELPPWFNGIFVDAASRPKARGRGTALAPYVPAWVPWLGPKVWAGVDLFYKQALAPHFLAAWDEAKSGERRSAQLDLSEFDSESSLGSRPGGPK